MAAEKIRIGVAYSAQSCIAYRRLVGCVHINDDEWEFVTLHFVDGTAVARPDGVVDQAVVFRIVPRRDRKTLVGSGAHPQHLLRHAEAEDSAQHTVDVVVLLTDVPRKVQLHLLVDRHHARLRPSIFPQ